MRKPDIVINNVQKNQIRNDWSWRNAFKEGNARPWIWTITETVLTMHRHDVCVDFAFSFTANLLYWLRQHILKLSLHFLISKTNHLDFMVFNSRRETKACGITNERQGK